MKKYSTFLLFVFLLSFMFTSCKKDDNPVNTSTTYPVQVTILNPAGVPQGGALVSLKNAPYANASFSAFTDSAGKALLQSPEGNQVFLAKIGTAFSVEIPLNVKPTNDVTQNQSVPVKLVQNIAIKILVVKASAENLEDVLRDPKIGFTTFTETEIDSLAEWANTDSVALYNYLKTFSIVFTNCHGSSESSSYYEKLSRTYGRYVESGGKMYGGHYNYYHLQRIWPGKYEVYSNYYNPTPSNDTLSIIDASLSGFLGFNVVKWNSTDSRYLSGYENFDDLPSNAKVYGIIKGVTPSIGVIVENYVGSGKYLWTNYHNQDIKEDATLIKLVQYFLYSL